MKKLHLSILALIFSAALSAQLTNVTPNSGQQGATGLSVHISSLNANFSPAYVQDVTFSQGSTTLTGYSTVRVNGDSLVTLITIPSNAPTGPYNLLAFDYGGTASISLDSAFTVVAGTPLISSVTPNSAGQGATGLAVQIAGRATNFSQASSTTVYFSQGSSTYLTGYNTNVTSDSTLTTYIDIPSYTNPCAYDLSVYNGSNYVSLNAAFTVLLAQINAVAPASAPTGTYALPVQISGTNTAFSSGSSTYVYFTQGSSTQLTGYNTVVNSPTSLTTWLDIPTGTSTGAYDLSVYNGNTDLSLNSAFSIIAGLLPQITSVDTNYSTPNTTLDVVISGLHTNFQSGSSTVWFSQGTNTIYANSVTVLDSVSLTANITLAPNDPFGFYDVNVSDYVDNTISLPYGFFVSDTVIGIVSVTGDSTTYDFGDSVTILITGMGTHFAVQGDTTTVWLAQAHRSEVPNIIAAHTHAISNTQISATFFIPSHVPTGYYDVFTYNTLDGELTQQKAIYLTATGITGTEADHIKVYPNPATNMLYIEAGNQEGISSVALTALDGTSALKVSGSQTSRQALDLSAVDPGIYILSVTGQSGTVSYRKIIVE